MATNTPAVDLLDINVWLALADENHAHHASARHYWEVGSAPYLAFTRVSMLGMLRLLTNRTVMQNDPFTVAEAWAAYRAYRVLPEVIWIGDHEDAAARADAHLADWILRDDVAAPHWTDAHLAAVALAHGCRLVSFDGGFRRYRQLAFLTLT